MIQSIKYLHISSPVSQFEVKVNKMKHFFSFFLTFILLILLTSCGNDNKAEVDRSEYEPSLIAYGYEATDVGNGWNLGALHLAFENTKDYLVPVGSSRWGYSVEDGYVETQEGKTYPIRVYADYSKFAKSDGSAQSSENYIDLNMPKIPPGFRVYKWRTENYKAGGNYIVEFKFALAAHPTAIIFPNKPAWNITLSKVPDNLQMPFPPSSENIKSLASFNGVVLLDDPGKLLITLGDCKTQGPLGSGLIDVVSQNRDTFDSAAEIINFPALSMIGEGDMTYKKSERINPYVGPGQTITQEVWGFSNDSRYVIFYWDSDRYDVAKIEGCK
jgi:hypothetical protein